MIPATWVAGKVRHGYQPKAGHMVRCCDGRKTYIEAIVADIVPSPSPTDKTAAKRSGYCPKCWEATCQR